jgi:hypothetical protein
MTEPPTVTDVLIAAVREARDRDGWNARKLAEACAAAGMPSLDQSTITNILNNRRQRIGVDEWLTLAYVLNLPPAQMLVPLTTSDRARLTPTVTADHNTALQWLLGQAAVPRPGGNRPEVGDWAPIANWRELWRLIDDVMLLIHERDVAATRRLPDEGEHLELVLKVHQRELDGIDQRLRRALQYLTIQYDSMREHRLSPPACEPSLLDEMDRLGVPRPKGMSE